MFHVQPSWIFCTELCLAHARYFARLSKSFLISSIGNHKVQQYFKNLSFRPLFVLVTDMVLRNRMLWKGSKLSNNSNHFRFLLSHKQLLISRRKRILKLFFFTDRTEDVIIRNDRAGIHHMMVSKICGPFFSYDEFVSSWFKHTFQSLANKN